jgi:hypothetical protein
MDVSDLSYPTGIEPVCLVSKDFKFAAAEINKINHMVASLGGSLSRIFQSMVIGSKRQMEPTVLDVDVSKSAIPTAFF